MHKKTPHPAIQPSSATAVKSANIAAKNASAVPTAAVRIAGPAAFVAWMVASNTVRPVFRSSS